jgi:hypothetical protein
MNTGMSKSLANIRKGRYLAPEPFTATKFMPSSKVVFPQ